jgi:hypothetical protein
MSSGNTPSTNQQSNNPAPSGTTNTSGTTGVTQTAVATTSTSSTTKGNINVTVTSGAGTITFTERLISDSSWPSELNLDLKEGNWLDWSRRLTLLADRLLVSGYLNGTLSCPDAITEPLAHQIWNGNDRSLRAFILERLTSDEFDIASPFDTSHTVFEALRVRHEELGLHAQINLLFQSFNIVYDPTTPMTTTSKTLRDLHERMKKMGKLDEDKILLILIINALGRHYPQLQSDIHHMTVQPNFDAAAALRRIETEASLVQRRAELGVVATQSPVVALTASDTNPKFPPTVCSNCKRPYHTIDFCIKPGGKMAGRTMDAAKAAQRAAQGKPPRPPRQAGQAANVATTPNVTGTAGTPAIALPTTTTQGQPSAVPSAPPPIIINGISYFPASTTAIPASQSANLCSHVSAPLNDLTDYRAFITMGDPPKASLNWENYSRTADLTDGQVHMVTTPPAPFTAARIEESPFVLDTGATCHISPERSDFQHITPIPAHPIKGLGGACIYAVGLGTIELSVGAGQRLVLNNALFAPTSSVRLISVLSVNRDSKCISCFDEDTCWIMDKHSGNTIAQGTVSPTRNLYMVTSFAPQIIPQSLPPSVTNPSTLYASRIPDLETWHR